MNRRDFVSGAGIALSPLLLPERVLADPYAPLALPVSASAPVRIRGQVRGNTGTKTVPLAGVRVSDGLAVVHTDPAGRFTLISDGRRPFVSVSTPAGWQPARNPSGTARFYQPIDPARAEQDVTFTLVPRVGDQRHSLMVLADPQTQSREETAMLHAQTVPDVVAAASAEGDRAIAGVVCGDIMFDDLTLYPEWERAVQRMGMPFYQVIGNHDLDVTARVTEDASATFGRHFGPTHYSFDLGSVHYVVINNVFYHGAGYLGYVDATQLAWLAADLASVERGAPVVVFLHIPALSTIDQRSTNATRPGSGNSTMNREALYRLLEPYRGYLISGHMHEMEHVEEGGPTHVVAGAVCGAWWSGPICYDGTPNGYLVLRGDDAQLRWHYQATGQPASHQLRGYRRGSDPTAPDDIVANVWGWDRRWEVTWVEDGTPRGRMSRRRGRDPLSVSLHEGPAMPTRRPWVDPVPTTHLFYATPSAGAREIVIEARDPHGTVYRTTVAL